MPFRIIQTSIALIVLSGAQMNASAAPPPAGEQRFYIGTYSSRGSLGIYQSSLDLETGKVIAATLAGEAVDPSFLALHPNRKFLYAVNEREGAVLAFSINPTNATLALLNQQSSGGGGPCHLVVDAAGKNVLVANYGGGSVTVLPIQADGSLGIPSAHVQHSNPKPHAHSVTLDAGNRHALVCDLGLNRIYSYRFDSTAGTLATNTIPWATVPTNSGPRHLAFDPQYRRAYVICETSSTIVVFDYDATNGVLNSLQTVSTLPADYAGRNSTAEIAVHPSGKFVYGSNRGYNSIAVFSVDSASGALTQIQQQSVGSTPRHFAIDPTGAYCLVANQGSGTVVIYSINPQTGLLTPTGQSLAVSAPVCVLPSQ